MTISKETGTKMVKIGLYIITPTIILLVVLGFLYWRKQKKKKLAALNTAIDTDTITTELTPESTPLAQTEESKLSVAYRQTRESVGANNDNVTDESSKPKIEKIA